MTEPCPCGYDGIDTAFVRRTGQYRAFCIRCQRVGPDAPSDQRAIERWDAKRRTEREEERKRAQPGRDDAAAWAEFRRTGPSKRPWP